MCSILHKGSVDSNIARLNVLISIDGHPDLLGGIKVHVQIDCRWGGNYSRPAQPMVRHDEGSIVAELMMDLDIPIARGERNSPGVLRREAPTLHQMPWMYPATMPRPLI